VLVLDLTLQSAELSLFAPVIERSDQHNDSDRAEDCNTFDPPGLRLRLVRATCTRRTPALELNSDVVESTESESESVAPTPLDTGGGGACPPLLRMAGHGGHREQKNVYNPMIIMPIILLMIVGQTSSEYFT